MLLLHTGDHPFPSEDECDRRDHRNDAVDQPHDLRVGGQAGFRARQRFLQAGADGFPESVELSRSAGKP